MRSPLRYSRLRQLSDKGLLLPLLAALGVLGVLLHGMLTRPQPEPPPPAVAVAVAPIATPTPPPTTLPTLRPDMDAVPLRYHSDFWLQLGDRARSRLAPIGAPIVTGVVVAPGVALTAISAVNGAAGDAESIVAERLLGFDEALGAALFELPEQTAPAPFDLAPPESLSPGALVAAVSLGRDYRLRVAPGFLISAPTDLAFEVSLDLHLAFPGDFGAAAIVDLEGRLAGFAVAVDGGRAHVFPAPLLTLLTSHLRNRHFCQAIEVADLSPDVREIRGTSGVLVSRVRDRAFVPESSIRPGDILVQWNGQALERADIFRSAYEASPPGERISFRVLRGRRAVRGVTMMPDRLCRPVGVPPLVLPRLGVTLRWLRPGDSVDGGTGWRVESVEPASIGATAGLGSGDWLVEVGGRGLSRESAALLEGLDRRLQPTVLTVQRGGRHRMLAVKPPEEGRE